MITNDQIIRESLEDLQNPKHRDEALENLIMIMTENAVRDQKEDLFDSCVAVDRARALITSIYNQYFSGKPTEYTLVSIDNSFEDIALNVSTVINLLCDAIDGFRKMDVY